MIIIVKRIGFHTETLQINIIMVFVFVVQFLNTGIIICLINANTREAGLPFDIFNGNNPDFTYNWYNEVGVAIISIMTFNAYSPLVEIIIDV